MTPIILRGWGWGWDAKEVVRIHFGISKVTPYSWKIVTQNKLAIQVSEWY